MKIGESKLLPPPVKPYQTSISVNTSPIFLTDFVTAVGNVGVVTADPHLTITKGQFRNTVSGSIELKLNDIYDFNPGHEFRIPTIGKFESDDIYDAIKCTGARNFDQTTTYSKILTDLNIRQFSLLLVDCNNRNCKIQ